MFFVEVDMIFLMICRQLEAIYDILNNDVLAKILN